VLPIVRHKTCGGGPRCSNKRMKRCLWSHCHCAQVYTLRAGPARAGASAYSRTACRDLRRAPRRPSGSRLPSRRTPLQLLDTRTMEGGDFAQVDHLAVEQSRLVSELSVTHVLKWREKKCRQPPRSEWERLMSRRLLVRQVKRRPVDRLRNGTLGGTDLQAGSGECRMEQKEDLRHDESGPSRPGPPRARCGGGAQRTEGAAWGRAQRGLASEPPGGGRREEPAEER
jgi:hypothetical protein